VIAEKPHDSPRRVLNSRLVWYEILSCKMKYLILPLRTAISFFPLKKSWESRIYSRRSIPWNVTVKWTTIYIAAAKIFWKHSAFTWWKFHEMSLLFRNSFRATALFPITLKWDVTWVYLQKHGDRSDGW